MARTIAIGDIHGCGKALRGLIDLISPNADDTLVFLGDYVDRGPDVRGVMDQLVALANCCNVVALRGNHEVMFLAVQCCGFPADLWLNSGGQATVASYGGNLKRVPESHIAFLKETRPFFETDSTIFVHAGYLPTVDMAQQPEQTLYWDHLPPLAPPPHQSGKPVYVGHTPQGSGMPLDLGHLVCLDTYCFGGLWLSAMDVASRELWQASYHGHARRRPFQWLVDAWRRRAKFS